MMSDELCVLRLTSCVLRRASCGVRFFARLFVCSFVLLFLCSLFLCSRFSVLGSQFSTLSSRFSEAVKNVLVFLLPNALNRNSPCFGVYSVLMR
jgi:hypothetical protein